MLSRQMRQKHQHSLSAERYIVLLIGTSLRNFMNKIFVSLVGIPICFAVHDMELNLRFRASESDVRLTAVLGVFPYFQNGNFEPRLSSTFWTSESVYAAIVPRKS